MNEVKGNKKITNGNYNKPLAVKCINGTFVGTKTENIIAFKGIPFVGQQPIGNLRWKAKEWPLYDLKDKRVMVLDEFDIHPTKESEVKIVDWDKTTFLNKYYML